MMGLTVGVHDPVTGERLILTAYLRNEKLVLQRLPPHLFAEGYTPGRLAALAEFGRAATRAKGDRMTEGLPPAAVAVRRWMRGRGTGKVRQRQSSGPETQRHYLELLGEGGVRELRRKLLGAMASQERV